jgi:hypothetical protein
MSIKKHTNMGNRKNILTLILLVIIFSGVFFMVNTSKVKVEADNLIFSGLYGVTLKYEDIQEVEIKEALPKKLNRTNGIDFFGTYLGNFKAENMNKLKLFVKSKNDPMVYIRTKKDEYIIFNTQDKKETEDLFNDINSKAKK